MRKIYNTIDEIIVLSLLYVFNRKLLKKTLLKKIRRKSILQAIEISKTINFKSRYLYYDNSKKDEQVARLIRMPKGTKPSLRGLEIISKMTSAEEFLKHDSFKDYAKLEDYESKPKKGDI